MATDYIIDLTDPLNGSFVIKPYTTNGPVSPRAETPLDAQAVTANTSIVLLGKGMFEYGERFQESVVHMLEHFAYQSRPAYAIQGQVWYKNIDFVDASFPSDPTLKGLYVWDGAVWGSVVTAGPATSDLNMNLFKIINLADATNPQDALNQQSGDARYVNLSGDTMTGLLILSGDPVVPLGAATKQYIDNAPYLNKAGDTMTAGFLTLFQDPTLALHAATKGYVDTEIATATAGGPFVSLSGDTMTGLLVLSGDPVAVTGAATKQYVDLNDNYVVSGIIAPSSDPNVATLTLTMNVGAPVVVSGDVAPGEHTHSTETILNYVTLSGYLGTVASVAYDFAFPGLITETAIALLDEAMLQVKSKNVRSLFTAAGGETTIVMLDMVYPAEMNRLQLFLNGVKQIANTRGFGDFSLEQPGIQIASFSGTIVGGNPSGLADTTSYDFLINVDGVATSTLSLTITTGISPTFSDVISLINAAILADYGSPVAIASIVGGNIQFTTASIGPSSVVEVDDGGPNPDLFTNLTGFSDYLTPVVGGCYYGAVSGLIIGNPYDFDVDIDGAGATTVTVTVPAIITTGRFLADLISVMNVELAALTPSAKALIEDGRLVIYSDTTGSTSSVVISYAGPGNPFLFGGAGLGATWTVTGPTSTTGVTYSYSEDGAVFSPGFDKEISYAITAVSTGLGGTFTITGGHELDFSVGAQFAIVQSTNNDGLWHVASTAVIGTSTVITVVETVGAVADGFISPHQSNVYTLNAALVAAQVVEAIRIK